jgi:hypothetical protein
MPDARAPRPDDRTSSGLSVGVLIVAGVIALHLVFALLVGLGTEAEPAQADPAGRGGRVAVVSPVPAVTPSPPLNPAAAEPAAGGRGSY